MNNVTGSIVTVLTAIVGVAILATLVSKNAQTPKVLESFGRSFSGMISAATAPVTGAGGIGLGFNSSL